MLTAGLEDKQVAAYQNMLRRYSRDLREECRLLGPLAKVWVAERLAGIENRLSVLRPSRLEVGSALFLIHKLTLQTTRIRCPKYKSHPWEIIQELGLGDVVREAVPLEVQKIFQKSVQVDLAVEPSGISRVRRLCELVDFQRLSEDDPIIQMQRDGDPRMRMFNGYNHVLRLYTGARTLRQLDGSLMLWYGKKLKILRVSSVDYQAKIERT
jgi:hypothetical protein